MSVKWAWCAAPPVMEDGQEEREFLRWRKWYLQRVNDALVNPLTEMELAVEQLERSDIQDPELREHVEMARQGQEALKEAFNRLKEATRMEDLK